MVPSSSGPGHQVLILKIAGSNPAGITKRDSFVKDGSFFIRRMLKYCSCKE